VIPDKLSGMTMTERASPDAASEAGRALNRARWGRTRTDRLVSELQERRGDLLPDQVEMLRELVAGAGNGKS
jgi:hypothetical protein